MQTINEYKYCGIYAVSEQSSKLVLELSLENTDQENKVHERVQF